jgi:creatinine amidohydrolase/Fe(II)-dependent formamide hydrolase-like protein
MSPLARFLIVSLIVAFAGVSSSSQILRLAEMNTRQIAALDRAKTVIIMPGGVMEQHGPHLPSFSDGYMNEWWTERLALSIAKRPGWKAVIFPTIPLGDGGANEIGFKYIFPGSYGVRVKTLRSVYMDLGTEFGEQGFKWVFVIQNHGSPMHNLALDQAGDYFHDTYGGQMINLFGLVFEDSADPDLPEKSRKENGIDIHAGASETSSLLFLKPTLVDVAYSRLAPITITDPADFSSTAMRAGWPGYFGSPRLATAAFGKALMEHRLRSAAKIMERIVDGEDPKKFPRYADAAMKREAQVAAMAFDYDAKVERRQQEWLKRKGIE